jgi:acyl-CoA reductase-like NAD-dependent aldehyde dehydrogenase
MGDPKLEDTVIGPVIDESEAQRLEAWINGAIAAGARLLCGGRREGVMLQATLLENVPKDLPLCSDEAFGPVSILEPFTDFDEALDEVNNSRFGLQAGVFTRDLYKMQRAWDRLKVGGVIIGDVPSWRVDNMPYGGVKDSGFGREGVRWAIEDMTEVRLLVIRAPP